MRESISIRCGRIETAYNLITLTVSYRKQRLLTLKLQMDNLPGQLWPESRVNHFPVQ